MKLPRIVSVRALIPTTFSKYTPDMKAEAIDITGELFRETHFSYFFRKFVTTQTRGEPGEILVLPKSLVQYLDYFAGESVRAYQKMQRKNARRATTNKKRKSK